MKKTGFIILFALTWILTYVSAPIKFASLSLSVSVDEIFKLVAIVLTIVYVLMSFVVYKWAKKINKSWLVSLPIIAGLFDVLNIPILPSVLCLLTFVLGVMGSEASIKHDNLDQDK